jgi:hypothetical protein
VERCSFLESGPVRCPEEAVGIVEHRYGRGAYCEVHADWVLNKWRPAPEIPPTVIILERRKRFLRPAPNR